MNRRTVGSCLLVLVVLVIVLSLTPWRTLQDHPHWDKVAWIPFVSPPVRLRDIGGNVLLFAPLGIAIVLSGRSNAVRTTIVAAFILSLGGETLQLYSHSRFPSATDLTVDVSAAAAAAFICQRWLGRG